jgi:hypothetical protein
VPLNARRQRRKSPMRDHSAVVLPTPATLSTRGQCPPMGKSRQFRLRECGKRSMTFWPGLLPTLCRNPMCLRCLGTSMRKWKSSRVWGG